MIDASALANGELKFRRWLNVGGGAISSVEISGSGGGWNTIWNSDSIAGQSDTDWSLQTLDVSAVADGSSQFQVRFKQTSGFLASANQAGWNVDRFVVRDGSLAPFGKCDDCSGGPSFAGADAAMDNDSCGAGGVTVSWNDAASWGTGDPGSYSVYRDTAPGFTPSGANLIAAGIDALSYNDATAPDGQSWTYLVRAESDETCGSGPGNGGTTDGNTSYVNALTTTNQTIPGVVEPILVDLINHAHVRISWASVADASGYRIYRSNSADPATMMLIDETSELSWEDLNQSGNANNWYYQVRAINVCGQE